MVVALGVDVHKKSHTIVAECESGHRRVAVVVSEAQAFGSVTPCRPFVDGWPFCVVPALG
jgi:rhodanese-related sulfurtransferase